MNILELRKKPGYRLLESSLGLVTIGFFVFLFVISAANATLAALVIIVYCFFWLLRVSLIFTYTIFSYRRLNRWSNLDTNQLIKDLDKGESEGLKALNELKLKHKNLLGWKAKISNWIEVYSNEQDQFFKKPSNLYQFPIFTIYNEPVEVLIRSLSSIYKSDYNLDRVVVFVSQEARNGEEENQKVRTQINNLNWTNSVSIEHEGDYNIFKPVNNMVNIVFTEHPDGLEGEIKGKASNEDWAGRKISEYTKNNEIDSSYAMVTSLDSDSQISRDYFNLLALHYSLHPKRDNTGFQPIPVYTNNYFECTTIPRIISTQTTLWNLALSGSTNRLVFFANYSIPLKVLEKADYWEKQLIAEDYLFYVKCLAAHDGNFTVVPFYGIFRGDTVQGGDYIESIENQYKQLQRWTWGGVESVPYLIWRTFIMKNKIHFKKKVEALVDLVANHHFWATAPFVFAVGVGLPVFFGGTEFESSNVADNLTTLSQYFAWMSMIFMATYGFLTYKIVLKNSLSMVKLTFIQSLKLFFQMLMLPFIYGFMAIPAIDSQIRGITGNYLGYWVTPKK